MGPVRLTRILTFARARLLSMRPIEAKSPAWSPLTHTEATTEPSVMLDLISRAGVTHTVRGLQNRDINNA